MDYVAVSLSVGAVSHGSRHKQKLNVIVYRSHQNSGWQFQMLLKKMTMPVLEQESWEDTLQPKYI